MAIGNKNKSTDYTVHCIHCGSQSDLKMMAHRIGKKVVGFVYVCGDCVDIVEGMDLLPKWKET